MSQLLDRITISPDVRSGKPVIRGTRITVSDILEYMANGMTEDKILEDFPDLTHEDILATLAFAAQLYLFFHLNYSRVASVVSSARSGEIA